jgi:hypothetical protein
VFSDLKIAYSSTKQEFSLEFRSQQMANVFFAFFQGSDALRNGTRPTNRKIVFDAKQLDKDTILSLMNKNVKLI